jgi:quinol-cytochrome oxidoreductase complex cytochrome b subunit
MAGPAVLWEWIDERVNIRELLAPLMEKAVPRHRFSHWYLLGGVTLFLFGVQIMRYRIPPESDLLIPSVFDS